MVKACALQTEKVGSSLGSPACMILHGSQTLSVPHLPSLLIACES